MEFPNTNDFRRKCLLLWLQYVLCPLVIGSLVYWLARPLEQTPFLQWLNVPPAPFGLSAFFPKRMIDALPSSVWAFSMTSALWLVLRPTAFQQKIGIGTGAFVFAFLYEILQWKNVIAGSFDPLDVAGSFLATVLVFTFLKDK